jgi:hypothetical protein
LSRQDINVSDPSRKESCLVSRACKRLICRHITSKDQSEAEAILPPCSGWHPGASVPFGLRTMTAYLQPEGAPGPVPTPYVEVWTILDGETGSERSPSNFRSGRSPAPACGSGFPACRDPSSPDHDAGAGEAGEWAGLPRPAGPGIDSACHSFPPSSPSRGRLSTRDTGERTRGAGIEARLSDDAVHSASYWDSLRSQPTTRSAARIGFGPYIRRVHSPILHWGVSMPGVPKVGRNDCIEIS